jgi:hypothetical protein
MPTLAANTFVDLETTIERHAGILFSTSTMLTSDEVVAHAVTIAQVMVAGMATIGHTRIPGNTTAEPETTLLRECNAVGAAWMAVTSTFAANRSPNRTKHSEILKTQYDRCFDQLIAWLKTSSALNLGSTDHIQQGDVTARVVTTTPTQGDIFTFDEDI